LNVQFNRCSLIHIARLGHFTRSTLVQNIHSFFTERKGTENPA
jgi:hypothetical protein